jgi:redox-sensitive bicupin YhaK (pirin superfamily)
MDVRRARDRFRTVAPGLDSRHSFSYGPHYDPDNLGFGVLMAHNEDRLAPGAGYDRHAHRGIDIVTWVLSGTLEHEHWNDGHRADEDPVDPGSSPRP